MKSYRKELWFETKNRRELINITTDIQQCLEESGIQEGFLLCNAMHITASVFINDDESGLHHDFEVWLEKLAPEKPYTQYKHNGFEDNADAHLKRTIMINKHNRPLSSLSFMASYSVGKLNLKCIVKWIFPNL